MRPYTKEEARQKFFSALRCYVRFWAETRNKTSQERCEALAESFCTLLDGCSAGFPAVDLVLSPHQDDEQDARENGENWFEHMVINDDCMLHEIWACRQGDGEIDDVLAQLDAARKLVDSLQQRAWELLDEEQRHDETFCLDLA